MAPKKKPKGKEGSAATRDKQPTAQKLAMQHTAYYNANTSEIKDDVVQLASCWKSGHGALTKQEAGLLLWYHCHRGADGQAEVVAAGVINTCLASLDNQDTLAAERSIAAGILLTLCEADPQYKETVVKAKAGPNVCCQVLHTCCISHPDYAPRHVPALLASLASSPASLAALRKTLQGDVPWGTYCCIFEKSYKDHAAAINTADYVRCLVTGHPELAAEAGSYNGLLQAVLSCAKQHKSATAVAAAAACLQALCEAAPDNRQELGQLPGSVQALVDLLGPPPAPVIAWEKQEYAHILDPPPPPPLQQQDNQSPVNVIPQGSSKLPLPLPNKSWNCTASGPPGNNTTGGTRTIRKTGGSTITSSMAPRRTGTGAQEDLGPTGRGPKASRTGSIKPAKSVQLPDIGLGEGQGSSTSGPSEGKAPDPCLNSKQSMARQVGSFTGTEGTVGAVRHQKIKEPRRQSQGSCVAAERTPDLPQPIQPLLCRNSTALKWEGPVPDATRSAVTGLLSELVLLPELCRAVHDRLGASRLAALLHMSMKTIEDCGGKKGDKAKKKKKKSASLTLSPESETYLCNLCVCLKVLVAADNSDCYRVASAGCLPALVELAACSKRTRLRQSAKAVLSQVCMLAELQEQVKQAEVPEELYVEVPVKLVDEELKQLQIEFPSAQLQRLDDVTARARM